MATQQAGERHFSPFGPDEFGRRAEGAARFFGTPQYILGQSVVVVFWIILNSVALIQHWDPYPFILLNLAFSTQAAYAAPLILLAQTRQADRDKVAAQVMEHHRDELATRSDEHQRAEGAARSEHDADAPGQGADRAGREADVGDPLPARAGDVISDVRSSAAFPPPRP